MLTFPAFTMADGFGFTFLTGCFGFECFLAGGSSRLSFNGSSILFPGGCGICYKYMIDAGREYVERGYLLASCGRQRTFAAIFRCQTTPHCEQCTRETERLCCKTHLHIPALIHSAYSSSSIVAGSALSQALPSNPPALPPAYELFPKRTPSSLHRLGTCA